MKHSWGKSLIALVVFSTASVAFGREVEFNWQPVAGALKYEIQVDSNETFPKPIQTAQVEKPAFSVTLPVGLFYYRVRVIDTKSRPGRWSNPEPVTVLPYAPELVEPNEGVSSDYYEIKPTEEFGWKESEPKASYEIFVSKTTGQKMFETKTKDTHFKTEDLGEGEYLWKVRTIAQDKFVSDYSDPRHFKIVKKPLSPPELIKPENNGVAPSYRAVEFNWKQDPHSHFADLTYEKVKGMPGAKLEKKTIKDLPGTSYTADYEEPGEYKWSINEKEGRDTPGVASPTADFEVRNDVISRGNYELEFSVSPVSDLYTTNSARQTGGNGFISQQSTSTGVFTGFLGGYYPLESLGFFISTRSAQIGIENMSGLEQETDLSMRLRFGSKGFAQEFIYGLRIMDLIEAENTPAQETTDFTTIGPLIGTRLSGTIINGLKAQVYGFYYKPTTNMEGISGLTSDVYGFSFGLKWNFMYQLWLGYRCSFERNNASFVTPGQGPGVNSGWTMYRTEPFYFSISFEH